MVLNRTRFFIQQQVEFLKMAKTYDILDPETQQQIAVAKEEPNVLVKILKIFPKYKHHLPTQVTVYDRDREVFRIRKPISLFRSKVSVYKNNGECLAHFKTKFMFWNMWKKLFYIHDKDGLQIGEVKVGDDWGEFKLVREDLGEIGVVTKKWAGMAKEWFTSADHYMVSVNQTEKTDPDSVILMLAAGLAIDIIYKGQLIVAQK